jgi:hypothetical protein
MKNMAKNWVEINKKYKGLWVALAKNEETVLGFGKEINQAIKKANKKGEGNPILFKVPKNVTKFVG